MSGQNEHGLDEIEFQFFASEVDVPEFWLRLQQVIRPGELVSQKALLKAFGRKKVWTYVVLLKERGFVNISVGGEVSIVETMRGKKYLP